MKGRPTYSIIRQNLVEILYFMEKAYGYELYKVYKELFPSATMRVIYYHLKKGTSLDEFKVEKVRLEEGDYSWGSHAEKIYYSLGPNAKPKINESVKEYFDRKKSG